jgi:hypothetical protein
VCGRVLREKVVILQRGNILTLTLHLLLVLLDRNLSI